MSVATLTTKLYSRRGRLIWTGRRADTPAAGLDGWSSDYMALRARIRDSVEIVVLDTPSFPWELLLDSDRDKLMVVALPPEYDLQMINSVLGEPVLRHLTPYDRLIESRPDVRQALEARWGFCAVQWLNVTEAQNASWQRDETAGLGARFDATRLPVADPPDSEHSARKAVWRQVQKLLKRVIGTALRDMEIAEPRVAVMTDDSSQCRILGAHLNLAVAHLHQDATTEDSTTNHVVGVLLSPDLGVTGRVNALRYAHRRLRAAGHLVVIGTVVVDPRHGTDPPPPSLSQLFAELGRATAGCVNLEELRSVRWGNEPLRRGVVLSMSSLAAPRDW